MEYLIAALVIGAVIWFVNDRQETKQLERRWAAEEAEKDAFPALAAKKLGRFPQVTSSAYIEGYSRVYYGMTDSALYFGGPVNRLVTSKDITNIRRQGDSNDSARYEIIISLRDMENPVMTVTFLSDYDGKESTEFLSRLRIIMG